MVLPGKAVVDSPDFVAVADSKALGLVEWITHREKEEEEEEEERGGGGGGGGGGRVLRKA